MYTQRYAVEFGNQVVGVAFRVPGGFMFIASDQRFDTLDGKVFPRARALARRLGEMCNAERLTIRGDECSKEIATRPAAVRPRKDWPTQASNRVDVRS